MVEPSAVAERSATRLKRDPGVPGRPPLLLLHALPVVGTLGTVLLYWVWNDGYWYIVREDRLAEWLTFTVWSAAAVIAVVIGRRLWRQERWPDAVLYALVAVAAVFVAGEEVSWFQRQLGFSGPDALVERNLQGEANLHNVLGRHAGHGLFIVAGLYGAVLARLVVRRVPMLRERPWLYVPPRSLVMWFSCCWIFYVWTDYLEGPLVAVFGQSADHIYLTGAKLQEVVELSLAGGVLLFLVRLVRAPGPLATTDPYPAPTSARGSSRHTRTPGQILVDPT